MSALVIPSKKKEISSLTLYGIDKIQCITIPARVSISPHKHDNQWEVWIRPVQMNAYICMKGEQHEVDNSRGAEIYIFSIKGHSDYTYDELKAFFENLGYKVYHGSFSTL